MLGLKLIPGFCCLQRGRLLITRLKLGPCQGPRKAGMKEMSASCFALLDGGPGSPDPPGAREAQATLEQSV